VLLAGLALSFATPLLAGAAGAGRHCPLTPSGGAPALVAGMDGGACQHTDAGPCLSGLGCVSIVPAVRPAPVIWVTANRLIVIGAEPSPHIGDFYRTGPPTPPPNLI